MSQIIDIAAAVATELNSQIFSQAFVAQRVYWTTQRLELLTGMRVVIVPAAYERQQLSRSGKEQKDFTIDVAIQKKVANTLTEMDLLMDLVEEIHDYLNDAELIAYPTARIIEVANDPIYSEDHVKQFKVFTSLLVCSYRVLT